MYETLGLNGHRNKVTETVKPYKIEWFNPSDQWNLFQNTPNCSIKGIRRLVDLLIILSLSLWKMHLLQYVLFDSLSMGIPFVTSPDPDLMEGKLPMLSLRFTRIAVVGVEL